MVMIKFSESKALLRCANLYFMDNIYTILSYSFAFLFKEFFCSSLGAAQCQQHTEIGSQTDVLILTIRVWFWTGVVLAGVIRDLDDLDEHPCKTYSLQNKLYLDCSDRGLMELPGGFDLNVNILLLSNNNFVTFPAVFENLTSVELLDMSSNHLSSPLPAYMEQWQSFTKLNLSNNNYGSWSNDGKNFSIRTLDLSKNKINNIDAESFYGMNELLMLDLSENRINDLPSNIFETFHSLDVLVLSRNYVSSIPNFRSQSLTHLYLSNCQITRLSEDSLVGLTSLLDIDLSMNQIEYIPDNLASETLQELSLAYNLISEITDHSFSSLPHLAVLDLRGNEFREIWSTSHFSFNPFLRTVLLKGNRWSCEDFGVNLLLTYEFLTKEPAKVNDKSSLICYMPANATQMSWQQAYIQTWHSHDTTTERYTAIAVVVGIIIGIFLTSIVCRFFMAINENESPRRTENATLNINGTTIQPRADSVVMRIPLREDLPPTYDEALLMPRLNTSFHSLPDFIDEEEDIERGYRRSRSIGDLIEHRPRTLDRRSIRRTLTIRFDSSE